MRTNSVKHWPILSNWRARVSLVAAVFASLAIGAAAHGFEQLESDLSSISDNPTVFHEISVEESRYDVFSNHIVTPTAPVYAQKKDQLRSRSEVVRQVKRDYNAEVLKISLNSSGSAYRVRILMPNGRVKEITVSARR